MATRITEELYLNDGERNYYFHPAVRGGCLMEAGKYFAFELCRRRATFGGIEVDRLWMALPSVYPQARRRARNYRTIVEYYRSRCIIDNFLLDTESVDTYILARLLPHARPYGSKRVFYDAQLTRPELLGEFTSDLITDLNDQLAACRSEYLTFDGFRHRTRNVLGPPEYPSEVWDAYREMDAELLGSARQAVQRRDPDAVEAAINLMRSWRNSFGRHRRNRVKKQALDIISCECRAALNRCYSAVWWDLLKHLADKYALSEQSLTFHALLHLDHSLPSDHSNARAHLFHGHAFALHPGLALLLQTESGGELVGDYLREPNRNRPFQRLLYGILVGLTDYHLRGEQYAEARKKTAIEATDGDMESVAARQAPRGRRLLPGPQRRGDDRTEESVAPGSRKRRPR